MKLYFATGTCSLAAHIVLREAGLPFELAQVDHKSKKTKAGDDFLAVNPRGMVPTLLLDNGEILTEVAAVLQYIAERKPEAVLLPKPGSLERYRVLEWLSFIATEIHKQFTPLFKDATPEDYRTIAKDNLARSFGHVDAHLAGKEHLVGNGFTVADAYLFVVTSWARLQKIDIAQWPNLKAFQDRLRARPAVQEAMKAEGLIKPVAA